MPHLVSRHSRVISLGVALLAFSGIARSQDWQSLGRIDQVGGEVLVDAASLTASRSLVTGKMLVNLDAAQPVQGNPALRFRSAVILPAVDCAANTVGVIRETDYTDTHGRGTAVFTSPQMQSPRMVPLASLPIAAPFFRYACDRRAQANGNGPKASDLSPGAAMLAKDPPPLDPDEEVIARMSWAVVQDARARNQDPIAAFGSARDKAPLRNCVPRSKTLEQFRECYRVARVQAAIADYNKVDAPGVDVPAVTQLAPTPAGGMASAASGAVPQITDAEWAAYQKAQATSCASDFKECRAGRNKFLYAHWPAPKATAQELAQPCRNNKDFWADDSVRQYANSADRQQHGGPLLAHWLGVWAGDYFPNRAFDQRGPSESWCSDGRFQIVQWQRAVGLPETGKIGKADVDDFVARWAPIVMRLNQSSQVLNAQLETAAHDKVQAIADRRAQEQLQEDALYANGPVIFDVALGSNLRDIADCGNHHPGVPFNPMYIKVPTTCYESYDSTLRFPPKEQPGWVDGPVTLALDREVVIGMAFAANDAARAIQTIDSRFGPHQTRETPMHQNATMLCDSSNNCVPGRPERHWIEVVHTWDTEKVHITAALEKGRPAARIVTDFKPVAQVRRVRAQMEEELGREEREKKDSQQKKF